ncbi:MAG: hypothetical protein QOF91_968 [Alphaproteobacteria bacterium]|nr:hypothetical protein [Alphaproteobacteria bacterium]MEA3025683.1 hypothetical protein [Alphaproteobacteria bacterium]
MWRKVAFLLIVVPVALLAFVLLLMNFGTMPRAELAVALAVVSMVAIIAMPAGITILGFSILMADRRRGRRERS